MSRIIIGPVLLGPAADTPQALVTASSQRTGRSNPAHPNLTTNGCEFRYWWSMRRGRCLSEPTGGSEALTAVQAGVRSGHKMWAVGGDVGGASGDRHKSGWTPDSAP